MTVVGIDIGGTSTRLCAVSGAGEIMRSRTVATEAGSGPSATIERLVGEVREIVSSLTAPLAGLGIGITGPIDPHGGIVDNPHTLAGWPPTDIRTPFEISLGVPVVVDNDANAAAVGEGWIGAGAGRSRLAMVTIGTGVGVALVAVGVVQRAVDGRHGEAGHMVLDPNGPRCYCGADGCWEVLASGSALDQAARGRAWRRDSVLWEMASGRQEEATARMLFAAAAAGDAVSGEVIAEEARWIGLGLVNLAATFMPDVFILAGSVANHLETLRPGIERMLRQHAVMIPTEVPVLQAVLGDSAGAVGAARMAMLHIGRTPAPTTQTFPLRKGATEP